MSETWKPVKGYEDLYEVSDHGNVRSKDRIVSQRHWQGGKAVHVYKGKNLKKRLQPTGYYTIDLHKGGKFDRFFVHRLVAGAFIEKPEGKDYINHLDNNGANNHVDNLEWCTQSENIQYAYDKGTKKPPHERKVAQLDLDGNLIKIWESIASAARSTPCVFSANIYKVCIGQRRQAGGYKWKYAQ